MAKDASSKQGRAPLQGPPSCCAVDVVGRPMQGGTASRLLTTLPPKPGAGSEYHAEDVFAAAPFCESSCRWDYDEERRSTWRGNAIQFITTLGFITGLHALCVFPVLCTQNGGLAFVIATLVLYLVLGGPLLLLETVLGQLSRVAPTAVYARFCPLLSGIGFSMMVTAAMASLVEACILSWSIVYMYKSADCELPWAQYENFTGTWRGADFFSNEMLKEPQKNLDFGNLQANVVISLAITWTIVMITISGGLNYIGKVACITTPLMFFGAILMVARGAVVWTDIATAAAAPQWIKLSEPNTWLIGAAYVLYSLRLGTGGLTTIGSHRSVSQSQHPIRNAVLLCGLHYLLGVMMWLAFESLLQGVSWNWKESKNTGGAPWVLFVLLARGLSSSPHGIAIAVVFYGMVVLSGLNTLMGSVLTQVTCLLDILPSIKKFRRSIVIIVSIILFFIGIPLTSQAGMNGYYVLMQYAMCLPVIIHATCMTLAISFGYGQKRFLNDIYNQSNTLLKHYTSSYLTVLLTSVIPVMLLVLLVQHLCCLDVSTSSFFIHPLWLKIIGWIIAAIPLMLLPIGAICKLLHNTRRHDFKKSCKLMINPDKHWIGDRVKCIRPSPLARICHIPVAHQTELCPNNYTQTYSNRSIVHICDNSTVDL